MRGASVTVVRGRRRHGMQLPRGPRRLPLRGALRRGDGATSCRCLFLGDLHRLRPLFHRPALGRRGGATSENFVFGMTAVSPC